MTEIVAGSAATCDPETIAIEIAEADFILAVQSELQRIMNAKGVRAKDLSKRMHVSEARVSQMFGEQAKNLTLRTIAKLYYQFEEIPVLTTKGEIDRLQLSCDEGWADMDAQWTVLGLLSDIQVGSGMMVARDDTGTALPERGRLVDRWARAEAAEAKRPRRVAAAG